VGVIHHPVNDFIAASITVHILYNAGCSFAIGWRRVVRKIKVPEGEGGVTEIEWNAVPLPIRKSIHPKVCVAVIKCLKACYIRTKRKSAISYLENVIFCV